MQPEQASAAGGPALDGFRRRQAARDRATEPAPAGKRKQQPVSYTDDVYSGMMDADMESEMRRAEEAIGGQADQMEAFASATSTDDLFLRLEACGSLTRIDQDRTPTMFHLATVAPGDVEVLRQVRDVVRLGHPRPSRHQRCTDGAHTFYLLHQLVFAPPPENDRLGDHTNIW